MEYFKINKYKLYDWFFMLAIFIWIVKGLILKDTEN